MVWWRTVACSECCLAHCVSRGEHLPSESSSVSADWHSSFSAAYLLGVRAMIRVTCPHCGSKLNAKDELAGQTRKCPKCAQPVRIVADAAASIADDVGLDDTRSDQHAQVQPREERSAVARPARAAQSRKPLPDLRPDASGGHVGEQRQRLDAQDQRRFHQREAEPRECFPPRATSSSSS